MQQRVWEPSKDPILKRTDAAWSNESGSAWLKSRLESEEAAFIKRFVASRMPSEPSSPRSSKRPAAVRTPRTRKLQERPPVPSGTEKPSGAAMVTPSHRMQRALRMQQRVEEEARLESLKASAAAMLLASREKRAVRASMRSLALEKMCKSRLAERAASRAVSERQSARVDARKAVIAERLVKAQAARQARQLEENVETVTAMACLAARQTSMPSAVPWGDLLSSMGKEAAAKADRLRAGEQRRQAWVATMASLATEEAAREEERAVKAEAFALSSPRARAALVENAVKEAAARVAASAAAERRRGAEEARQAKAALRQAEAAVKAQLEKVAAEHEAKEFDAPAVGESS